MQDPNFQTHTLADNNQTLGALRKLLNELAEKDPSLDELKLWQGTDSGEGYLRLCTVTVANARHVDYDGDDADDEMFCVEPDEEGHREADMGPGYVHRELDRQGNLNGYKNVLVLGDHRTPLDIAQAITSEQERLAKQAAEKEAKAKREALKNDPEYQRLQKEAKEARKKYGL
jgi:hypothetical protein